MSDVEKQATPLGRYVRSLRVKRKWSQAELARRINMSPSTVSGVETGRVQRPPANCLAALARAFGIPVARLERRLPAKKSINWPDDMNELKLNDDLGDGWPEDLAAGLG